MEMQNMASDLSDFFTKPLASADAEICNAIRREQERQESQIELIAPKNYQSRAARDGLASIMGFTSVEGYPGNRYHAGIKNIDEIESIAIDRAKKMFGAAHANVQPHSGTQANQAIYFSCLKPGDLVLSMKLESGGHLSHGLKANQSGKWFPTVSYSTNIDGFIDYDEMERLAKEHKPRLIIVGGSSYPRAIDFKRTGETARGCGAKVLADVSHFAGLIVAGLYPSPFPHADFVTTTTNKNLRGPRGGLILVRDVDSAKAIDAAVFPGIQGGPLPEMITAKAISFGEALGAEFKLYAQSVLDNARALAKAFMERSYHVVTGGTDTPLVMIDLRSKRLTGDIAQEALEAAGLTCNKNLVPYDPEKPKVTSGLRFGTSAVTARGMREPDMMKLANMACDVLDELQRGKRGAEAVPPLVQELRAKMARDHSIYHS
jgi:glycine hydroxymethyltransferase